MRRKSSLTNRRRASTLRFGGFKHESREVFGCRTQENARVFQWRAGEVTRLWMPDDRALDRTGLIEP